MNNTLKNVLIIVAGVIIGFLATRVFVSNPAPTGGSTNYGGDLVVEAFTANGAVTLTGDITASGDLDVTGPINSGTTYASSTSAGSATLDDSEIEGYTGASFYPTVGDMTLTFPATSTMNLFISSSGDRTSLLVHNATTTSGIDVTLAEGTGWQFGMATSTTATIIPPDSGAVLDCYRKSNTDIFCQVMQ